MLKLSVHFGSYRPHERLVISIRFANCISYRTPAPQCLTPSNLRFPDIAGKIFEIIISTYYGIDFDDEFADEVDENGLIELVDGTKIEFESVKRNGYDTLQIWATNDSGKSIDIVSEELA